MNTKRIRDIIRVMSDAELNREIENAKRNDRHLFSEPSITIYEIAVKELECRKGEKER